MNFLVTVYNGSIPDVANIRVAEADGDVQIITRYLDAVIGYASELKEQLNSKSKTK